MSSHTVREEPSDQVRNGTESGRIPLTILRHRRRKRLDPSVFPFLLRVLPRYVCTRVCRFSLVFERLRMVSKDLDSYDYPNRVTDLVPSRGPVEIT